MVIKINRVKCLEEFKNFPLANYREEEFYYPTCYKGYTLTLSARSMKGHLKKLAVQITNLCAGLEYDNLVFMGEERRPWLFQQNDYGPVKAATDYLTGNKVGKRFNGALKITLEELPVFLNHFSWIVRCNAALPTFYFMDEGQNIVGDICRYGNLHLFTVNKETDVKFNELLEQSELESTFAGNCYNKYSKTSAILGRRTVI